MQKFLAKLPNYNSVNDKIKQLLKKENLSLEELLDEDELLQALKSGERDLVNFFDFNRMCLLIDYITKFPIKEDSKLGYKFPFVSCEVLCCNIDSMINMFFQNHETSKIKESKIEQHIFKHIVSDDEDDQEQLKNELNEVKDTEAIVNEGEELEVNEVNQSNNEKLLESTEQINSTNNDKIKYELLDYLFNFLAPSDQELNEVLTGYFYKFFSNFYKNHSIKILKYIISNQNIFDNLLFHSKDYSIAETISIILDSSQIFDLDLEYINLTDILIEKLFSFVSKLNGDEILKYTALYSICEKLICNKQVSSYILRNFSLLKYLTKNCFLGINLQVISTTDVKKSISKLNVGDYIKFKKIRKITIEILNKLLIETLYQQEDLSEIYLLFKPISVKFCMKLLINVYNNIDQFRWFYNEDKEEKEEKINDQVLALFYKVYSKEVVIKLFSIISQVLLTRKIMLNRLDQNLVSNEEKDQVKESYDYLGQFKNSNGEDIVLNSIFGDYLIQVFPIFTFLFQITEEKIKEGSEVQIDSTFNNLKVNCLGEEKISLIQFFTNLMKFLQYKNAFLSKMEGNWKIVIENALDLIQKFPFNNLYQYHALEFFKGICSLENVNKSVDTRRDLFDHFKQHFDSLILRSDQKINFSSTKNMINELFYSFTVEIAVILYQEKKKKIVVDIFDETETNEIEPDKKDILIEKIHKSSKLFKTKLMQEKKKELFGGEFDNFKDFDNEWSKEEVGITLNAHTEIKNEIFDVFFYFRNLIHYLNMIGLIMLKEIKLMIKKKISEISNLMMGILISQKK